MRMIRRNFTNFPGVQMTCPLCCYFLGHSCGLVRCALPCLEKALNFNRCGPKWRKRHLQSTLCQISHLISFCWPCFLPDYWDWTFLNILTDCQNPSLDFFPFTKQTTYHLVCWFLRFFPYQYWVSSLCRTCYQLFHSLDYNFRDLCLQKSSFISFQISFSRVFIRLFYKKKLT